MAGEKVSGFRLYEIGERMAMNTIIVNLGDDLLARPFPDFFIDALVHGGQYINRADVLIRLPVIATLTAANHHHLVALFKAALWNEVHSKILQYGATRAGTLYIEITSGVERLDLCTSKLKVQPALVEVASYLIARPNWREERGEIGVVPSVEVKLMAILIICLAVVVVMVYLNGRDRDE